MKGKRFLATTLVTASVLGLILGLCLLNASGSAPRVQISSHKEIPLVDGLFRMGPSTGFTVPFTLTQTFNVPAGATEAFGTIAPGPCEGAEFFDATPGYEGPGAFGGCGWIKWVSPPAQVSVTARYIGYWVNNWVSCGGWYAKEGGEWVQYCLIGEPDEYDHCTCDLYFEAQPAKVFLPITMKGYSR